jgi:hypothetical protein
VRRLAPVAAALIVAAGAIPASAHATVASAEIKPMLILDRRLELTPVQVNGISQSVIQEVDARGQVRTRPVGDVLALLPIAFDRGDEGAQTPDAGTEPASTGSGARADAAAILAGRACVTLVDGERIVGRPDPDAIQEDALAWHHDSLGSLVFRLERVMRIVFAPVEGEKAAIPAEPSGADDVVVLRNGDRLTGFVVRVQPDIEIESGGQTLNLPIDRVARVELVNEPEPARGTHLWLADGTRIAVHSLAEPDDDADGLKLFLDPPSESPLSEARSIPLHELVAIAFEAGQLAPLTDRPMVESEPDDTRRTGRPPVIQRGVADPLGAGDILLPGPMTAEWSLPDGAMRLAGWVTLPQDDFLWGDCNVTFETLNEAGEPTETAHARLRGMTPTVRINEELPSDAVRLRVHLESGEYGAIQDQALLQRFILLTDPE